MEGRGRAKGRGRGTRGGPQGSAPPGGPRPGPPQQQQQAGAAWGPRPGGAPVQAPQQAPGATAWNRPPQHSMPQAPPQSQQTQWARPPVPQQQQLPASGGRGSRAGATEEIGAVSGGPTKGLEGGDGDRGRGAGNGGVRGRTNRNEIIQLRPANVATKKGTDGERIMLKANYFPFLQVGEWGLFQYRVDFNPEVDMTKDRKNLVRTALQGQQINGYLFDGTVLYTPTRIMPDPLELFAKNEAEQNIRITIRLVGDVNWSDWAYVQLFGILLKKCLGFLKLELLGRNYFDSQSRISVPEHGLELWPGYSTAIRQCERRFMLNAELTFKVLRLDDVYKIMLECQGRNPKEEFQQRVIGSVVMTTYNKKTYRIDDVDFNATPASTFPRRDGSQISYQQYFQEKYGVRIKALDQPMLVSRSKQREIRAGMPELVYLVPELCMMTGLTDRQRENFQLMRSLAEHTRVGPQTRMQKLEDFCRRLQSCPEVMNELKRWDLKLADRLVTFEARKLPAERLFARNNQQYTAGDRADWTMHLRSNPMFNAQMMEGLAVLCPVKFKQSAQSFMDMLGKAAKGMHWNIGKWKIFDMPDDRTKTYLDLLEQTITRDKPTMVMCVLSNNSGDRYNAIKKKCCVDRPIPSQVILGKNLSSKGAMSIATKVAIQLNCKIGGAPWGTSIPKLTMVVGYDVCRDTVNKKKSFSGMVASMDMACTRYYSRATEHDVGQELSSFIGTFMVESCKRFREINGAFPERIIFYRDGVGEGQINYVKLYEIDPIKKMLTEGIYKEQPLKMAYIVVSKRINTRLFREQPVMVQIGQNRRQDWNPPPGTVVDDEITLPERYDFFLVSQCVNQGTVTPTNFNVLEDTTMAGPSRLQQFSYKMCHMYFNWSGTVRVPAPCQYAHKLAFLTSQSLHRAAHINLANTLYYL